MEKALLSRINKFKKQIATMFSKINEYDRICVFRHNKPDYDAFGTQLALVEFIKTNFKNKEVIYVGDDHVSLTGKCFPKMMNVKDEWFEKPFLAIIVDLSNIDRIADERCKKSEYSIKIDHHPLVEKFADLEIVDDTMVAAGEFLAAMLLTSKYKVTKECAAYLWKAIVGDSGRFLYQETTAFTFSIAQKLMETGIDAHQIYAEMYNEKISDLEVRKFILQNYKVTKHGVAYYILKDEDLRKFNLMPVQGKDNINLFSHIEGINAWISCTEDKSEDKWRISLRSADKPINGVAAKYGGGGHAFASGCKVKDLKTFMKLIEDLDKLF